MTWKVTEITVQANYASNHPPETLTIPCQSVSEISGGSKNDMPGSSFKYPRLTASGVDAESLQKVQWVPNRLFFRDLDTGVAYEFSVQLLDAYEDTATFTIRR